MSKVWLIGRHEFLVTVSRPSFRIIAAIVPVAAAVAIVLYQAVQGDDAPKELAAGFVDFTRDADGQPIFRSFLSQDEVTFVPFGEVEEATESLLAGEIDLLYVIPGDYLETGIVHEVKEERAGLGTLSGSGANLNTTPLGKFLLNNLFVGDVGADRAQRVLVPFVLATTEVDESGSVVTDPLDRGRLILFLTVAVLLMVSVFTTSGYLLQGLNEEKENRIMEVLLSSVKPEQLMLGKLAGLGAAGLAQMAIWTASGVVFVVVLDRLVELPTDVDLVPGPVLLFAGVYFVLGYFFFGTLMAALGAVTTSQREASQITFLIVMPGVAPLWFLQAMLEEPESALARTLSLVPFTAPMVGLMRLGVDGMGPLDLLARIAVLAASVALVMALTVRLFRAYLLMYGQRPGVVQILRTLRGA